MNRFSKNCLLPKDGEAAAADQQAIEELIQIIEEYEAQLMSKSDSVAVAEGQLADLERSIESRPNRVESYLRLARAYQEAGRAEKTTAVCQQARERFPEDERVQRESEAFEAEPERPLERSDQEEN